MLSPVSCRKCGWDVSHFSLAAQSLLPGTPAASLQTRGRAQPTLSPMLSEPGWIPPGGAGTGTQEDLGQPRARGGTSRQALPGERSPAWGWGDPKQILSLPDTSIHSPVFPALPGHKETLPSLATAWPGLQPQGKGSTDFWLNPVGKGNPTPLPGLMARMDRTSQVWVWINLPLPLTVCSKSTQDPRACGGMGISTRERILQQHSSGHKISPSPV